MSQKARGGVAMCPQKRVNALGTMGNIKMFTANVKDL